MSATRSDGARGHLAKRAVVDPTSPQVRYGVTEDGTCHVLVVSDPRPRPDLPGDVDLDDIARNCPWAMRANSLDGALQAVERAGALLWRDSRDAWGQGRWFDSIEFVGHAASGRMRMGRAAPAMANDIRLDVQVLQAFTQLRRRFVAQGGVLRLLGCDLGAAQGIDDREALSDGVLLAMALARMVGRETQVSQRALGADDFDARGLKPGVALLHVDGDGALLPPP